MTTLYDLTIEDRSRRELARRARGLSWNAVESLVGWFCREHEDPGRAHIPAAFGDVWDSEEGGCGFVQEACGWVGLAETDAQARSVAWTGQ